MDEIDDLLSSLHDHLEAACEKADDPETALVLNEARSLSADLADEASPDSESAHEHVELVLGLLDGLDGDTGNEEVDKHVEAVERAAERVLER